MAFNINGAITISDVRDGVSAPTIILSNENHTFPADQAGTILGDLTGFSTTVSVFVGSTQYDSSASSSPTGTNFYIGTPTVTSGADLTVNIDRVNGVITVADAGTITTGFVDTGSSSVTISLPITVAGITGTISRTITLAKSLGGSAPIANVAASTQTFNYDGEGMLVTGQADLVLQGTFVDTTGNVTWHYRTGGGSFTEITGSTSGATLAPFNSVANAQLTLTAAGYNSLLSTNNFVQFRVTRGMATDYVTVARLNAGRNALSVVVTIVSGSQILKSDTQTVVIRADVYQNGVALTPGNDWEYLWSKDGTELTSGNQAAMTGATQQSGEGFDERSLRITGAGITDNMASLFSVAVSDPS